MQCWQPYRSTLKFCPRMTRRWPQTSISQSTAAAPPTSRSRSRTRMATAFSYTSCPSRREAQTSSNSPTSLWSPPPVSGEK
eukprot:scaffold110151_cov32-Prasinocladus_malaysianus.AAC.1